MGIRVGGLQGPSGISLVKMMQEDTLALEQGPISYIIENDPELIKAMMIRNDVDLALIPFNTAVILYNKGIAYQLVGIPVWGSLYLMGNDTTIESMQDLKGREVYIMGRNMTPDIVFRHLLHKEGLTPHIDLSMRYTFPTPLELAGAFQSNRVSLGLVSEPMMSMILYNNSNLRQLLDITEIWEKFHKYDIPLPQTALMVRKDWAEENPEILEDWCDRYDQSIRWINTNPEKAGILAEKHGIAKNPTAVGSAIPRCRLAFRYGIEQRESLFQYLMILKNLNANLIGNKLPDDGFFYTK